MTKNKGALIAGIIVVIAIVAIIGAAAYAGEFGAKQSLISGPTATDNQYFYAYTYSYPSLTQTPATVLWTYTNTQTFASYSGSCTTEPDSSFALGTGQTTEIDFPITQGGTAPVSGIDAHYNLAGSGSPIVCNVNFPSAVSGTTGLLTLSATASGLSSSGYQISYTDTGVNGKYLFVTIPLCSGSGGCSSAPIGVTTTSVATTTSASTTVSSPSGSQGSPYYANLGWSGIGWYWHINYLPTSYSAYFSSEAVYNNWESCGNLSPEYETNPAAQCQNEAVTTVSIPTVTTTIAQGQPATTTMIETTVECPQNTSYNATTGQCTAPSTSSSSSSSGSGSLSSPGVGSLNTTTKTLSNTSAASTCVSGTYYNISTKMCSPFPQSELFQGVPNEDLAVAAIIAVVAVIAVIAYVGRRK